LSPWLSAGGDPAQIAARPGNSVAILLTVYTHCIHGRDDLLNQQIGRALGPSVRPGPYPSVESQRSARPSDSAEASGYIDRATTARSAAGAVRYTSVTSLPGPPTAQESRRPQTIAAALPRNI
jgi:hypothetical protein